METWPRYDFHHDINLSPYKLRFNFQNYLTPYQNPVLAIACIFKVLPEYLSVWTTEKVKAEGVSIINNAEVKLAKLDESGKISLSLNDGQTLETDHVIVAVGIEPETQLAKKSGLEIDATLGGFKVNDKLESRYVPAFLI